MFDIHLARTRPKFDMHYDVLVVSIGSENNTFNIPGVEEHAHFLKEVLDARRIRSAISDAFESAMTPTQSIEEKKRLLHFVVVGGGPTGVEFAAEVNREPPKTFARKRRRLRARFSLPTSSVKISNYTFPVW